MHCFNAIKLDDKWIKVDARGNTNEINAQFSLGEPILAFENRQQFDEYFFEGIFSQPDTNTMDMLNRAKSLHEVFDGLPDKLSISPDIK